ncbi:GYF-like protein, partial [Cynara cardunculus var. scolymus]
CFGSELGSKKRKKQQKDPANRRLTFSPILVAVNPLPFLHNYNSRHETGNQNPDEEQQDEMESWNSEIVGVLRTVNSIFHSFSDMEKREGNGSFFWMEEPNEQTTVPVKLKRKAKAKMEFVGWGSRPLIEFLESIGKDTGKQLSQYDVTAIINEYVHNFNLFHPLKKKKVMCDERLRSLFGKKSVPRIKIYDLLESHFAENHDSSEDDDLYNSEEYENVNITCKKQKVASSEKKAPHQKKKVPETPLSCFAAIIPENIKLLYLKRRVKNVPGSGDVCEDVLLQVPNVIKDIPICKLSDDDFSKEECEDLCQRIKDGLLKRPLVVEAEQKARLLHEDITKHLLQTPSELTRLLAEVPKVTADILEPEATPEEHVEDIEQLNSSPITTRADVSHLSFDSAKDQALPSNVNGPVDLVGISEGNREPMANEGIGGISFVNSGQNLTSVRWVEAEQIPKIRSPDQALDLNSASEVIELSDDEEKPQEQDEEYELSRQKWFYWDPQGRRQGPVSRYELKRWSDAGYFSPDFKIWEDGEAPSSAILLTDLLSGNCSK